MKHKKLLALLLALSMAFTLTACKKGAEEPSVSPSNSVTESAEPSETPSAEPSAPVMGEGVRLAVLSGPTGIGAAKLLSDSDADATVNHYDYTIAADNSELVAGLTGSDPAFDIATVALQ